MNTYRISQDVIIQHNSHRMNEVSQSSVREIYSNYFDIIDSYFGSIKRHLGEEKDSHIDLGRSMASYPLISDLILDAISDLDKEIEKFWGENASKIFDYIKSSHTLKCVYSGDISPIVLEDFIKRSCLYVDSVVIADPILNLTLFQKQILSDNKYYLNKLIRHVFNVWKMKDLILADSKENILFILPINVQLVNAKDRSLLVDNANIKFKEYINLITDQKLHDAEEARAFLEKLQTIEDVFDKIKNPKMLPNIFQDIKTFSDFFSDFADTGKYSKFRGKSMGWDFCLYIQSQFMRVQEHKFFCDKLIAEPLYDIELPWFFFNHEMGCRGIDEAIVNSLQKEKFEWITKVPISAIKVLRSENKLEYMRSLLRMSITDLKAKNDTDLLKVSEQIEQNFKEAFKKQESELKSLEKEVADITKKEIPITTGGFLAGFVPYLGNVVSIVTAGRDTKNLLTQRNKVKNQISEEEESFINLLMKSHDER